MSSATSRGLSRPALTRRLAPFALLTVLAFAAAALPSTQTEPGLVAAAVAAAILVGGAMLVLPWARLPAWTEAVPPVAYLGVVVLLRESGGGASSGYAPLAALPVVWLALHGTRAQVLVAAAGVSASFFGPIVLLDYPPEELRRAVLWTATAPLIGLAISSVVNRLRAAQAAAEDVQRAEEAASARAQAAEQRFEGAFTSSPLGLAFVGLDGSFERINPALERMVGRAAHELGAETVATICHPGDRDACAEVLPRLLDGEASVAFAKRWVMPDGQCTVTQAHAALLYDEAGEPVGMFCQWEDVTARDQAERALRDASALIDAVLGNAGAAIYAKDLEGRLLLANPEFERVTGVVVADALGRDDEALFGPAGRALRANDLRVLAAGESLAEEERLAGPDGERIFASTKFPITDGSGRTIGTGGVSLDVTAARHAEQERRMADERFRRAFDDAPIGMALITAGGLVERANEAFAELCGRSREQLAGMSVDLLVDAEDHARSTVALEDLVAGRTDRLALELRFAGPAGDRVDVAVSGTMLHGPDGRPTHVLGQFQDVTERKRLERRLHFMADHDPLTNLFNRRRFEHELERHAARIARYGAEGAVVLLDVDHFKAVNDTLGHAAGDELVMAVAGALRERLRTSDTLARLGGDEFAVILARADMAEAVHVAEALVDCVRALGEGGRGAVAAVTASVGVALFRADDRDATGQSVVADADHAMYAAKRAGRDRYVMHAAELARTS